jgi:hypothetical protein
MNWLSGVQFKGWFKTHLLTGPNTCSFTFADGAKWEGQLLAGDSFCITTGEGLLTLPNGLQKQVRTHRHNRTLATARAPPHATLTVVCSSACWRRAMGED